MPSTRLLAAIMFTDIVGYTALMGKDEQWAFEILRKNRSLQKPLIEQYGGKWIKELGDGVLASFNTVSDAVQAAIKIQEACNYTQEFSLRIGIHQGEVVIEQDDIFGDTVNIASRIQAMAPVGGIWVSETVHHNISNKPGIATRFIKEEILKNVKEPVRIYEVTTEQEKSVPPHHFKRESKTVSEKSIAVLPFINMSSDPEQEYFSAGLTEEIISDLSKLEKLLVISRNSMMTFKGTHKKTKEIAAEVNARYVLEGSIRKAGNNLRITAQLIDANNDTHVWAEKYTGTMDDVFEIQENVSRSIVEALNVKLTEKEEAALSDRPIQNTKAYESYILARQEMWKRTEQGLENAIILAQRGLDITGDNALLYAIMSSAYFYFIFFGIRTDPIYEENAKQFASKSLAVDTNCAQAYLALGVITFKKGNVQEAAHVFKKMLQIDPGNSDAMVWLMVSYIISGRPEAAIPISQRLIQVDPLSVFSYSMPGDIKFYSGEIEESLPYFRKWIKITPDDAHARYLCAYNFAANYQVQESIDVLDSLIRDMPTLIYGKFAMFFKSVLQGDKERALKYASEDLKREAASLGQFTITMAFGYLLIDEKEEVVWWLNKSLEFGYSPYPLMLKWKTFQQVLKDHPGFQIYLQETKRRSEQFII